MIDWFDAFWRALAQALHPHTVLWTLLLWLAAGAGSLALGYLYWEAAVDGLRAFLDGASLVAPLLSWLDAMGGEAWRAVLVPLLIVAIAMPLLGALCALFVAWGVAPRLAARTARRRFASLERRGGAGLAARVLRPLAWSLVALLAIAATAPLWLLPPLAVMLPSLVLGWLGAQVLAAAVLDAYADADERVALMQRHRWPLRAIGIVTGLIAAFAAAPWALGAAALVVAPLLLVLCIGWFVALFAFSSLWLGHYLLAALSTQRAQQHVAVESIDAAAVPTWSSPGDALAVRGR